MSRWNCHRGVSSWKPWCSRIVRLVPLTPPPPSILKGSRPLQAISSHMDVENLNENEDEVDAGGREVTAPVPQGYTHLLTPLTISFNGFKRSLSNQSSAPGNKRHFVSFGQRSEMRSGTWWGIHLASIDQRLLYPQIDGSKTILRVIEAKKIISVRVQDLRPRKTTYLFPTTFFFSL